jgi:riboflavin biosynthesis pyrimidine reductase/predicted DsbA family dithiol-disulfide isomerase
MSLLIPVAHDFSCPWCWIGMFQARRLRREFGARIEWRGYELYPDELELPGDPPERPRIPNRPETPKRIELALTAEGLDPVDLGLDSAIRTHSAHEAVEFAKGAGVEDELVERFYRAYWKEGRDLSDVETLLDLSRGLVADEEGLGEAIRARRFAQRIVPYNQPAYATGVFNLPTFWIGGERYAEQPYRVLADAVLRALETKPEEPAEALYANLDFPAAPAERPYAFCNMVATIDGKTVSGTRDEGVMDLGSKADHRAMRRIEDATEAVMIGAQTLRSTPKVRFDPRLFRIVVTRSGRLEADVPFFTEAPGRAIAVSPVRPDGLPEGVRHWQLPSTMRELAQRIKEELGVSLLLVEGGSELNASLLREDLLDELFLTIAPKVKLGRGLPTYAGGEPLPRGELLGFELISERRVGDEVFLRYRRRR